MNLALISLLASFTIEITSGMLLSYWAGGITFVVALVGTVFGLLPDNENNPVAGFFGILGWLCFVAWIVARVIV